MRILLAILMILVTLAWIFKDVELSESDKAYMRGQAIGIAIGMGSGR